MKNNWKELSEGMPIDIPCEVMQKGGKISIAAYHAGEYISGICQLEERECGEFYLTNTFLMKVEKFRELTGPPEDS